MRKKRIIIISSILGVLAVLIILTSTVFMLSSVKVNFLTSGMSVLSENDSSSIIKCGKFNYGGNILFMNFDKQITNIEQAFPFAKVMKVERKFPNKAIVHIVERSPAFHVIQDGIVYILDSDLKVLSVVYSENFNSSNESLPPSALNCPQLLGIELSNNLISGQFENNASLIVTIKCIEVNLQKISHSILELSTISIQDNNFIFKTPNNEIYLEIEGNENLDDKLIKGFAAYFKAIEDGITTGKVHVYNSGEIQVR